MTELLAEWRDGDDGAAEAVLDLVYADLRRLAGRAIRREAPGHTLQPTALVHEACIRLLGGRAPDVGDRVHLLAVAARVMRQVLVNHAIRRRTVKRGGGYRRVDLDLVRFEDRDIDLLALDDAMQRLAALDPRQCRLVELRFFGGLTVREAAAAMDVSVRTVEREWTVARAWLRRELSP